MDIHHALHADCIQLGCAARDKQGVLRELAALACRHPLLNQRYANELYEAFRAREAVGSTGFGSGVAIPHCVLPDLKSFALGILCIPEGCNFQSLDGQPTRLLVFIVGPSEARNEHVRLLSSVSRVLDNAAARTELLATRDPVALRESFLRYQSPEIPTPGHSGALFLIAVQREDLLKDVLRVLSSIEHISLVVLESRNAAEYLDKMPLFAALWNEPAKGYCRLILAVVDQQISNDVVRRLHVEVKDLGRKPGIMVTVQPLLYHSGSLSF